MRLITALAPAVALAVVLSGCSSGGSGDTAAADGPSIETKFGSVDVPADVNTVVALGWGDAETALALGVQPVGASDWVEFGGTGVGPWASDLYTSEPEIIDTLEPDYEAIAALGPDLILDVKSSGEQERYDRLSEIAPTIGVPEGGDNYLTSMDEQVTMIAQALGKEKQGEEALQRVEDDFAAARSAHPEFEGKTVTVAARSGDGWAAYTEGSERVQLMVDLGFAQSPTVKDMKADGFSAPVSEENLDQLDADLLVMFPIYVEDSEVTDSSAFRAIPAVEDGRSIVFTDEQDDIRKAFSLSSVLSTSYAVDEVSRLAADALG